MQYCMLVMLYTVAMLAVYGLFLRNRTQLQLARYYLLAAAFLPFALPLLQLPVSVQAQVVHAAAINLPELTIGNIATKNAGYSYRAIAGMTYALIAFGLLVRCLWQVGRIYRVVRTHGATERGDIALVTAAGIGPGSFGRYVFFPQREIDAMVLQHEQAHVRLRHTRDLLLLSLLQAIAWPHLLLVWIRKELEAVHEFQADAVAGADRRKYMQLLVHSAFHSGNVPLMHSFIVHPIKRRIMMLQKNKTTSLRKPVLQVSAALLVIVPAIMAFQSCTKQEARSSKTAPGTGNSPAKGTFSYKTDNGKDTTVAFRFYEDVDVQPEFPGGTQALMNFLGSTVKYPEAARRQNIQGRVIVKFGVSDKGEVLDPEVVRSPDPSLSAAALDAVRKMPVWKPGIKDGAAVCVAYTLPISFRLDN